MIYTIFRNNISIAQVKPLDSSELFQKKQQQDEIRLNFILNDYVNLKIGDYITYEQTGVKYYLNKEPKVIEAPKRNSYECIFEGGIHELRKTKVFLDTPKVEGSSYRDYKFPLTGNAQTFLSFIVDNLNRQGGVSYVGGTYKETSTITESFNNWDCFEAINSLSETLDFDWWIEYEKIDGVFTNNRILHFDTRTTETAYVFNVGRNVGFTSLTRYKVDSEKVETVVYGFGSTENMPPRTASEGTTYDSSLLTENRLAFVGVDGDSKLTKNVDLYGTIESVQEFDDIKPEFTGNVFGIDEANRRVFIDDSINFDINDYLLAGITPKITFLTGKLIGLTFPVSYDDDLQQITMDYYKDDSGQYPNDLLYAEVGDQYKLFDMYLPNEYIEDASGRLQEATQEYIDKQGEPQRLYAADLDKEFIDLYDIELEIDILIRAISSAFALDQFFNIKELTRKITDPNSYKIKFGDIIPVSLLNSLKISKFTTNQDIYNVSKNTVNNNEVTNIVGDANSWVDL